MTRCFYCICRFRDKIEPDKPLVMLYRFRDKQARDEWSRQSPWRVPVTRDIARLIFPVLRGHEKNSPYWVDFETTVYTYTRKGQVKIKAQAQYFVKPDEGIPYTESFEMIPDHCQDAKEVKARFRREMELKGFNDVR